MVKRLILVHSTLSLTAFWGSSFFGEGLAETTTKVIGDCPEFSQNCTVRKHSLSA